MSRSRTVRAALVAGLAVLGTACADDPNALAPRGTGAREIAVLWWVMFGLGVAVFALVLVVLARTVRRPPVGDLQPDAVPDDEAERRGTRWMLLGGVILPVVVIVPISVLTLVIGDRLWSQGGDDALSVELVGHQYWWEVRYPDTGAVTANEIHIPVGRDVRVSMTSEDVIHSFWVPSLHGKVDLIPGEDTHLVFDADRPGRYEGLCAEFCGIQHTHMKLLVVAHPPEEFEAWLARESADAEPPRTDLARAGAEAFATLGCASCHAVRGTDAVGAVGPDLTHLASRLTLGANTIPNDRGNLGGWIADPQRIKPGNKMPPTVLDADELRALIAYLEGLE
jgi:cytochrome c oxidase subunit 2